MEHFYKITKEQADLLGKITYSNNQVFDPYCGETVDGFYLVSEEMYLLLKTQLDEKIDFTELTKIEKSLIELKVFEL